MKDKHMSKISIYSFFFLPSIIFLSCEKNSSSLTQDIPIDSPILFSKIYVNYAWGYQYSGWYVDLEGRIFEFDEDIEPKLDITHNATISKEGLLESLQSASKTDIHLDRQVLSEMIKLINPACKGELTDPQNVCMDFGTISYFTFIRDQKGDTYRSILVYQAGDWARKNIQSEALELFVLLRKHVDNDPSQLPCSPK